MAATRLISTELSWWSDMDGKALGTVVLDHTDRDYGWIILVRDGVGRFCCTELDMSIRSERRATAELRVAMARMVRDPAFTGVVIQGEEPKRPLNLLEDRGVPVDRLHKNYLVLRDQDARFPARKVIEAISPWMTSSDPHLVKEFQESQFDQRLWEIYLWAMFRDQGYDVSHMEAPDLLVKSPWFNFAVEATTVSPSQTGPLKDHPKPRNPEEMSEFLHGYMAIKYASPLRSKLDKKDAQGRHYWEKPEADGLPFVIAIADFHHDAELDRLGPMTYSQGGLYSYIFGQRLSVVERDGRKVGKAEDIEFHEFNGKKIETGFFKLEGTENVSAVLFSNAATLAKFDRLGVLAGFKPEDHTYIRQGFTFDPDPDAFVGIPFRIDITHPSYQEFWGDEVQVFHNPNAKHPLSWEAFPDAVHYSHRDGEIIARDRPGRVLSSVTQIFKIER
ncbi:MAG: hypothetical protein AAF292_17955 [Pseudomonadota bacterium]